MLLSLQPVRQNAQFSATATYQVGEGKGGEHPVVCDGANVLLLFIYVDKPGSVTDYTVLVEWHGGGDDGYAETQGSVSAGIDTRSKTSFTFPAADITAPATEMRYVVVVPVLGRFARISAKSTYGAGSPIMAILAGTATTVGGEGKSRGPFLVKTAGTLATSATITGDGIGTENPVPIAWADRVVLLIDAKLAATSNLQVWMEVSPDGMDFYRETYWTGSGAVTANLKKYSYSETEFGGVGVDGADALSLDAFGAAARFSFNMKAGSATNLACRAIAGRA